MVTPSEAKRLVKSLDAMVSFIRKHVPADVIAAQQKGKRGWERVNAALSLKPTTDKNVSAIAIALAWGYDFLGKNYNGPAPELDDAIMLMAEIGLLKAKPVPEHPTRQ
jgi:hypothetical protein